MNVSVNACFISFIFYFGETVLIEILININEKYGNFLFFDDNIKYEKNLTQLKDYILSKITYKKFKKPSFLYMTKYYFELDDKAKNVEYSVDDFELFKNTLSN